MRRLALVAVLVACGSKQPPPHEDLDQNPLPSPRVKGGRKPGATAPNGPAPACPATFGTATGACRVAQECDYPEGTCRCEEPGHCGGANLPRAPEPLAWSCVRPPPKVKPDGCPGEMHPGQPCSSDGKVCKYAQCCATELTCQNGRWEETRHECPP